MPKFPSACRKMWRCLWGRYAQRPHRLSASYVECAYRISAWTEPGNMDIHSCAADGGGQRVRPADPAGAAATADAHAISECFFTLIRVCCYGTGGELSTLAVQKHVTLDHERLNAPCNAFQHGSSLERRAGSFSVPSRASPGTDHESDSDGNCGIYPRQQPLIRPESEAILACTLI